MTVPEMVIRVGFVLCVVMVVTGGVVVMAITWRVVVLGGATVVVVVGSVTVVVVGVGVSTPRYGCGTGSGVATGALDERGPKPMSAPRISSTPSTASANTYQGGRLPGPAIRPSPLIRTPLTDRVRRG